MFFVKFFSASALFGSVVFTCDMVVMSFIHLIRCDAAIQSFSMCSLPLFGEILYK